MSDRHTEAQATAVYIAYKFRGTGQCISCGIQTDSASDWVRCPPCRRVSYKAYQQEAKRQEYQRIKVAKAPGVCSALYCPEPAKKGHKKCAECLRRHAEQNRRHRLKRRTLADAEPAP